MSGKVDAKQFEEAVSWFLRVRSATVDSDVHVAWLSWIEADPVHRQAFVEVQRVWDVVGEVEAPPWPRPEEMANDRPVTEGRRHWSFLASVTASCVRHRWWYGLAAASCVLLVVMLISTGEIAGRSSVQQHIATARGERQSAMLPDGSRIELGGLTGVELIFTPHQRLVVAQEGEAFYKVSRDPARPFVVEAGPLRVTAVGTAFTVRREGESVSVVVTEGKVDVASNENWRSAGGGSVRQASVLRAEAGQRVQLDGGRNEPMVRTSLTEVAPTQRRNEWLRFEDEPLRVVVASLNRYAPRPIVLDDDGLGALRFTGTVYYDRIDAWLQALPILFPAELSNEDPTRIHIRRCAGEDCLSRSPLP